MKLFNFYHLTFLCVNKVQVTSDNFGQILGILASFTPNCVFKILNSKNSAIFFILSP